MAWELISFLYFFSKLDPGGSNRTIEQCHGEHDVHYAADPVYGVLFILEEMYSDPVILS